MHFFYEEPSDYLSLPAKVKWMFHCLSDCEFVFKCDTDSYLSIPRLLASGFENYDYSGWVRSDFNPPYAYGPGYWVSRKAMQILTQQEWAHPTDSWAEDVLVGATLARFDIAPHNDDRYSHFTPVLPGNDKILQHLTTVKAFQLEHIRQAHQDAHGR